MITIRTQAVLAGLLLALISETLVFAGTPVSQQKNLDSASKSNGMKESDKIILRGVLNKKMTVGYRSPYLLVAWDAKEFEVRGSNLVGLDQLEKFVGEKIELTGRQVTLPSQKASPESEAGSRFFAGIIPQIEYIEAISIRKIHTDRQ